LFAGLFVLTGCAVHFIAPYDSTLDTTMTQVQQGSELFFTQLQDAQGTDKGSYDSTKDFYLRTEATLHTLLTRAQSVPKSDRVADQIANIEETIERIQGMHQRDKVLSPANLAGDRATLESEFRSFFTLELALKTRFGAPSSAVMAPAVKGS
jgi:hypothetical protein